MLNIGLFHFPLLLRLAITPTSISLSEVLPELYYPKFVGTSESSFEDINIDIAIVTHVIALLKSN